MAGLRVGQAWQAHNVKLFPEESLPIEGVAGPAIEVQTTIQRCAVLSFLSLPLLLQCYFVTLLEEKHSP